MKPLVVIDTNVLLSGLKSRNGASFLTLRLLSDEQFDIAISVPLVLEYEMILKRHLVPDTFTTGEIDDILDYFCSIGHMERIYYLWRPYLKDPFDDHVLELALASGCNHIITYNTKDFREAENLNISVLEPYSFVKLMAEGSEL